MKIRKIFQADFKKYLVVFLLTFGILILGSCSQQKVPTPQLRISSNFDKVSITNVVAGELTKNDKVYKDTYADYYDLELEEIKEGTEVTLLLESKDFLPYLYLLDATTGEVIDESGLEQSKLIKDDLKRKIALLNFKFNGSTNYQLIVTSAIKTLGTYELVLCTGWVRNNNDSGFGSLREAVANAWGIGAICFDNRMFNDDASEANKTISLESEIIVGSDVYIYGPGVNAVTVSGGNSTRIFRVLANTTATIKELTITKGWVDDEGGGAIRNQGNLTLKDSIISESFASSGGGISNYSGGEMILKNVKVENNTAYFAGGGISNSALLILDTSSLVIGNTAYAGGGMYNLGTLTIQDRGSAMGNTATHGGGILNDGNLTLKGYSSIISNVANTWGGGIYNATGTLTMQNLAIISGNRATDGGGIYNDRGSPLNGINLGVNVIGNQPNNLVP